ncbi:hypothetical protein BT69DRAFT_1320279 [Atractiella rhizophila]|nr:hypothetical protein BT69DRAFT_1320279 [Atractiella rhizophila]
MEHFAFLAFFLRQLEGLQHLKLHGRFNFRGSQLNESHPAYRLKSIAFRTVPTVDRTSAFSWLLGNSIASRSLKRIEFPHQASSFPSIEELELVYPVVSELRINLTAARTYDLLLPSSASASRNGNPFWPLQSIEVVLTNSTDFEWFISVIRQLPFRLKEVTFLANGPFGSPTDFLKLLKTKQHSLMSVRVVKYTGARRVTPEGLTDVMKAFQQARMSFLWEWEDIFLQRDI